MIYILDHTYDCDSIIDIEQDIYESFAGREDMPSLCSGKIRVVVTFEPDDERHD